MASFDYDVVIIGSGFGGSVAALRAAEKGYRVGVMESGQALDGRGHPEDAVGPGALRLVPRRGALRSPEDRVPRRRARPLRRRRRRRLARVCEHDVRPTEAVLRRARSGRASPIGPTSWRRTSTRPRGCSASSATRTCPRTSTGPSSRSRTTSAEGRPTTRPHSASTSARRESRPTIRTSAGSGRGAPAASPAATATTAAATTPRTS